MDITVTYVWYCVIQHATSEWTSSFSSLVYTSVVVCQDRNMVLCFRRVCYWEIRVCFCYYNQCHERWLHIKVESWTTLPFVCIYNICVCLCCYHWTNGCVFLKINSSFIYLWTLIVLTYTNTFWLWRSCSTKVNVSHLRCFIHHFIWLLYVYIYRFIFEARLFFKQFFYQKNVFLPYIYLYIYIARIMSNSDISFLYNM